jgi:hypothetical protein
LNNKNTDKDILKTESNKINDNVKTGTEINIVCDFCDELVYGKKHIINFANIEGFFGGNSCKDDYSEKCGGTIKPIEKIYEGDLRIRN